MWNLIEGFLEICIDSIHLYPSSFRHPVSVSSDSCVKTLQKYFDKISAFWQRLKSLHAVERMLHTWTWLFFGNLRHSPYNIAKVHEFTSAIMDKRATTNFHLCALLLISGSHNQSYNCRIVWRPKQVILAPGYLWWSVLNRNEIKRLTYRD